MASESLPYLWAGISAGDPGLGHVSVVQAGGQARTLYVSAQDSDGTIRNLAMLAPGDGLTITDDPASPPITGFARYVITAPPMFQGPGVGYFVFQAIRTDTTGSQTPPAAETPVRLYAQLVSLQEVAVSTTEPTLGEDLWVNPDTGAIKYRDPAGGGYLPAEPTAGAGWITVDDLRESLGLGAGSGDDWALTTAVDAANAKAQGLRSDLDPNTYPGPEVFLGTVKWAAVLYLARNAPSGMGGYDSLGGLVFPDSGRSSMAQVYSLLGVNRPAARVG